MRTFTQADRIRMVDLANRWGKVLKIGFYNAYADVEHFARLHDLDYVEKLVQQDEANPVY